MQGDRRGKDHPLWPDRHRLLRYVRLPEVQRRPDGRLHPHRRRARSRLRRPAADRLLKKKKRTDPPDVIRAGQFCGLSDRPAR